MNRFQNKSIEITYRRTFRPASFSMSPSGEKEVKKPGLKLVASFKSSEFVLFLNQYKFVNYEFKSVVQSNPTTF
jgi:hypothetical protein